MKNHMKHIILLRLYMPQKMLLHSLNPHLHLPVPTLRHRHQNLLQVRYILLRHKKRKRLPVQNLEKRRHKVVRYNNRNTVIEYSLHHSRTVHFKPFGANAVLARLHELKVVLVSFGLPAKKASVGLWEADFPPMLLSGFLGSLTNVSGNDVSLPKTKPSLTSELHKALILFAKTLRVSEGA
ncbi:hypothetical protein HID58_023470 [Brassica napus]|uniref:Uncharacterized protein n=1 Tax=Brassica napus TaxID=3708 RepID=A0ABQ8D348_BRANA|nr:hypothetical protein HID58_023470 [Brassica napus]